jgi:Spy/CpxP family protein refolding chaperone
MLIRLRKQLELTDEQVERIWKIGQPARRRMAELEVSIGEKEHELGTLLASDDVGEQEALSTLEELHALHLDVEKLRLLTPLRLRAVLTPEQRSKLVDLWHERAGEGPGRPPPMPPDRFGPHPGKGPPGPPGYPPYGPPGKGPPGPFGAPPPGPFDNGGTPLPYEPR